MKNKTIKALLTLTFALLLLTIKHTIPAHAASTITLSTKETLCLNVETLKEKRLIQLNSEEWPTVQIVKYSTNKLFDDIIDITDDGKITGKKPGVAVIYLDTEYVRSKGKQKTTQCTAIGVTVRNKNSLPCSYLSSAFDIIDYQIVDKLINPRMDEIVKLYNLYHWAANDFYYAFTRNSFTRGVCYDYTIKFGNLLKIWREKYGEDIESNTEIFDDHIWNTVKLSDGKYYVIDATWENFLLSPLYAPEGGYYKEYKVSELSKVDFDYAPHIAQYYGLDIDWYETWRNMIGEDLFWKDSLDWEVHSDYAISSICVDASETDEYEDDELGEV